MHVCVFMIAAVIIHQIAAFHDTLHPLALQFFPPSLLCSVGFGRRSVNGDVSFVLSAHQSLSPSSSIRGCFLFVCFLLTISLHKKELHFLGLRLTWEASLTIYLHRETMLVFSCWGQTVLSHSFFWPGLHSQVCTPPLEADLKCNHKAVDYLQSSHTTIVPVDISYLMS